MYNIYNQNVQNLILYKPIFIIRKNNIFFLIEISRFLSKNPSFKI